MPYTAFKKDPISLFYWFQVNGNSIHEIALLYQKKQIDKKNILVDPYTNKILVRLVNKEEYPLQAGDTYHLYLLKDKLPGYMYISLLFTEDQYVAPWFRFNTTQKISDETWTKLYGESFKTIINLVNLDNPLDPDIEYNIEKHLNMYDELEEINHYSSNQNYYLDYELDEELDAEIGCDADYFTEYDSDYPLDNQFGIEPEFEEVYKPTLLPSALKVEL